MRRSALPIGISVLAGLLYAAPAVAESNACAAAAEQGQRARVQGKLLDAHRHFLACAAADCPAVVAKDCTTWAAEVLAATPTIVIDAKDDAGHDVGDATLGIDGQIVTKQLDGKAIAVDPGSHTIEIAPNRGGAHAKETIIAKESEKARPIRIVVPGNPAAPAAASSESGHTIFPWLVVGLGGVFIVSGVILHLASGDYPEGCSPDSGNCTRLATDGAVVVSNDPALDQRRKEAGDVKGKRTAGTIGIVAGGVLVAGGLVWHFLEPTGKKTALVPWYNVSTGGLMMQGAF